MKKRFSVHHGLRYESRAEKIKWFRSLSFSERYRLMVDFADFLNELSPPKPRDRKLPKTVQILKLL